MSVNKWIGIGRLTREVEMKYSAAGLAVASFTLACDEKWTSKSGEKKESVEFIRCVAFKKLAEVCGKYLTKGKQVYIEGKLTNRSWEKDGVTRYTTEIKATTLEMLGSKSDSQAPPKSEAEQKYKRQDSNYEPPSAPPEDTIPF